MRFDNEGGDVRRVQSLADQHEPREIAAMTGLTLDRVESILGQMHGKWVVQCGKTGRWWQRRTERGCYLQAQIAGLVDYEIWRAA